MTIELNRKQTWALGTEATLDTKGENEAFEVNLDAEDKIRNDINVTEDLFVYKNYGINDSRMTEADKDPPMDGLELWFSPLDFRPEFDVVEDTINGSNIQVELIFRIKVLPPGKGFRTLFDSDLDSDDECTIAIASTAIKHNSKDIGKELDAEISLIIGRKNNEKIDVL